MSLAQADKLNSLIQSRFFDLMLSEKVAFKRLGLVDKRKDLESARQLLDIENKAIQKKVKQQATAAEFREYVNEYFHEALFEYLEERTLDTGYLFSEILTIEPIIADIMDACAARATTASQLDTMISQVTFLTRDLLKMVNNPPFRAEGSKRAHVDNTGLAVRYVGVENVKFALLTYIAKNWLPHSTEPYPDFKNRFWQYSIATANCAKTLAKYYKVDPAVAFMLGLVHGIGMSMSLRLYLRAFDTVRLDQMKKLSKANRKDIVKAIDSLVIDDTFVSQAVRKLSPQISQIVATKLDLKFAPLTPAMDEIVASVPFKKCSPLTRLLLQSQTFVRYKMLQKSRLIELDEAKLFLSQTNINNDIIAVLNKVNLLKLDIRPQD